MKRALVTLLLLTAIGCKKKAPEPVAPAPAPVAAPAPAPVPAHVQEIVANFQRVYFDFDASDLNDDSKAALDANVALMQQHTDVKVQIQGHADERGTTDYNLALGNRRAETVKTYLANAGVAGSRLSVISFGEERPAVAGSSESAWSKNRRAEFVVTWGQGVTGTAPQ